jgi:uncharacterized NAD(P)/FAD-binding protein YdhS
VIGGGASSVSLIAAILDEFDHKANLSLTIFVIEKRSSFGRGLAYAEDCHTNLLNTRAGYITPFSAKPGHFHDWLTAKRDLWEDDFPGVSPNADAFLPRALFGAYLESMVGDLVQRAIEKGCRLIPVRAEAMDVSYGHDGRLVVTTNTSLAFQSDHVVLSCGNVGSREFEAFKGQGDFFASPYPLKRLARQVPSEAAVGILGSRLSAIDAVTGLVSSGHTGPLTLHSRTGALPCVRGTQGRYAPRVLTPSRVEAHLARFGRLTLDEAIGFVLEEMEAAGITVDAFNPEALCSQESPAEFLRAEIAAAEGPRIWQAVLYSTNAVIDQIWNAMPHEDRCRFWPYVSWWMSYRVSIPIENAKKLLVVAASGRLDVVAGDTRLVRHNGSLEVEVQAGADVKRHRYDAVVSAIGTPRNPKLMDSPLIEGLVSKRIATCHPFGGLVIDPESGCLIDAAGKVDPRVTVLGELTSGSYFFTSVLEINARHAARRATTIFRQLAAADSGAIEVSSLQLSA